MNLCVPLPKPEEVDIVITHKSCPDGFGSIWAAHKCLNKTAAITYVERAYEPTTHGLVDDIVNTVKLKDKCVAIFDFSFNKETTEAIKEQCGKFVLWDHHESAQQRLGGTSNCFFDMSRAGCILAWKFFHKDDKDIPLLLLYVEDRDLWKWSLPHSREVSAASHAFYKRDFDQWDILNTALETHFDELVARGRDVLTIQQKHVEALAGAARIVQLGPCRCAIVNSKLFISEVGEELLKRHKIATAIVWYYDHHNEQYSVHFRGDITQVHVGNLAKALGGGGHPESASFKIKSNNTLSIEALMKHMAAKFTQALFE
jgi:nanoRNase/pAp phosphatase (c-di-AMP/oligoRNAs hydrolase)